MFRWTALCLVLCSGAFALVAMATVADVMPIHGENRILVRHGLASLVDSTSPGIRALMAVSGCQGKRDLSTGRVGFSLAPRISAAGRLAQGRQAVELLDGEALRLGRPVTRALAAELLRDA